MIISKSYKCPGCGGVLCFDPSQQAMYCEYCDSYWSPVTMKKQNKDKNPIVIHSDEETGVITDVQSYICSSCGGTVYADRNTGATWCPFCRGAIVIDAQFTEDKAPDFIIPFQIDKQTAINSFKNMLKETKWLPKETFEIDAELNMTAIYIPFWFNDFDIEAETEFIATEKSYVASPEHEFVITEKWLVPRSGKIKIRNLPTNGSINVNSEIIEAIEPFSLSQRRKFDTFYLSGFLAEKYSIDSETTKERALQRAKRDCLNRIGQTIAFYEKVDYKSGKYEVKKEDTHYGLCPVYLMTISVQGKNYTFALNGQTGKYACDVPVDKKQVGLKKCLPLLISFILISLLLSVKFADEFIPFFLSFCGTSIFIALALYFKTIYNITKNKYRTKTKVNNYVSSANIDFSDSKESIKRTVETKSNMFINTIVRKKYEKKKSVLQTKASNPEFMQKIINYSKRPYLTKTDKQLKID